MRAGKHTNRGRLSGVSGQPVGGSVTGVDGGLRRPLERRPVPEDPKPAPGHRLLQSDVHTDTAEATCVRGDLIVGAPGDVWNRLPLGALGSVLVSDGTGVIWSTDQHNLLSSRHGDTTASSPTRGDLIVAQGASPTWSRLAKSATSTHVLKAGASEPAWGQVAFSELSGNLTDTQHGALTTSSSHQVGGDLSGTTANATVAKVQNKAVTAPVAPTNTGQYLQFDGSGLVWASPSAGSSTHNLLSATHPDTTAASPTRGDLIVAQGASPTWSRLALGSSGKYLRSDGTDAAWAQIPHTDLTYSGLTAGQVLKASGASAASFAALTVADLTYSGLTAGQVLRATGASSASFGQLLHSQLGSIGANDHHNQAHTLFSSSDHSDVTGTPASGDLIYRNGSSQWARLAKGSDGQILKLASGLPSWANVNSVATTRALIQGWKRDDIRNANATDDEMNGFDGLKTGETMAYSGTLVGIAVALEKDIDNGGGAPTASYTLTAYKSSDQGATWSATAVTVTVSAGASTERRGYATGFSVSFAAGDMLTIYDRKSGLPAITNGCKANLIVVFD